jgi:signal transduction histidine kinase
VSNLLRNAVKYGGSVALKVHGAAESVALSVHNGGNPIPPAMQASVFEPLAPGESNDARHGLGLALFIARQSLPARR